MQRFSSHLLLILQPPPRTRRLRHQHQHHHHHPAQWHLAPDSPSNTFHILYHLRLIGNLQPPCVFSVMISLFSTLPLFFFLFVFFPLSVCRLPFLYHLDVRDRRETNPSVVCVAEKWERNLWNQARPLYWFICMQESGPQTAGFIGTDDLGFMFHTSLSQSQSHSAFLKAHTHTHTHTLYLHLHFSSSPRLSLSHAHTLTHTHTVEEGQCAMRVLVWGLVVVHLD